MRLHHAALVLLVLACRARDSSQAGGAPPAAAPPRQVTLTPDSSPGPSPQPTSILRALYERLTAGEDRVAVRSKFGEPRRATAQVQPNAHDATATDTLVQWSYDHLRFQFLVAAGNEFLLETRAAADHPAVVPLIGQLGTLEVTEATLGAPEWTTALADTVVYGYNVPYPEIGVAQNAINLYFVRGHLVFVSAVPYVD